MKRYAPWGFMRSDKPEAAKILDLAVFQSRKAVTLPLVVNGEPPRNYLDDMAGYLRRRAETYAAEGWYLFAHMLRQEADRLLDDCEVSHD